MDQLRQRRHQRQNPSWFTKSQRRILCVFFPALGFAVGYLALTMYLLGQMDFDDVEGRSPMLFYSSMVLEFYLAYMVIRDIFIAIRNFFSCQKEAFWYAVASHYLATCFDFVALTAIAIWSSVGIRSGDTAVCKAESDMCLRFYNLTFLNTFMAFAVLVGHCLIVPTVLCVIFLWPDFLRRELEEYNQSLLDPYSMADDISENGSEEAEYLQQRRAALAKQAVRQLTTGTFSMFAT